MPLSPRKLTDLERQAYLGFMARYRAIDLEATLARDRTQADERAFVAALAERLGLDEGSIGTKYTMNTTTWTLDRVRKPSPPPKPEG